MSDQQHNLDEFDFLKPVQFSLRGMLIATTIAAVAFAMLGPELRRFPASQISLLVGATIGGVVLWLSILMVNSARFEKARATCGRTMLIVEKRRNGWYAVRRYATGLFVAFFGVTFIPMALMPNYESLGGLIAKAVGLMLVAFGVSNVLTHVTIRVRRYCVFCENGYFHGTNYMPWGKVHRDRWRTDRLGPCLEVQNARWLLMKLPVYEQHFVAIEKVLVGVRPKYCWATEVSADM